MSFWRGIFQRADGTWRPGWRVLLFLACNGLATSLAGLAAAWLVPSISWTTRLWISAAVTTGVSWLFLTGEGRSLKDLGWGGGRRWAGEFGAGFLGGFLLMGAVALTIQGAGGFHWTLRPGGSVALAQGAWLFLAVAFREEVLFRGYPFQRLVDALGPWVTLLLTSLGFAAIHWGNPGMSGATRGWASVNIALAGLLLGLCYLKTGRLALPIGLHLGWNWTQGSLLGFPVSGIDVGGLLSPVLHDAPPWLTGGHFGLEASLPCALYAAAAVGGLLLWKRREGP